MNTIPSGKTGETQPTQRQRHDHVCRMVMDEFLRHAGNLVIRRKCHVRLCRRRGLCSGPMVESALSDEEMRHYREQGLGNRPLAMMPSCLAYAPDHTRAFVLEKCIPDMIRNLSTDIDTIVVNGLRNAGNRADRRFDKRRAWKRACAPGSSGDHGADP